MPPAGGDTARKGCGVEGAQIAERGYDQMAEQYLAVRGAGTPFVLAALEHLTRSLPPAGTALDIGCEHVPAATLIRESLTVVEFPPGSFDVVVAFHSIIHVPRTEQPALIGHIHRWLRPGGAFLATWAALGVGTLP